MRDFTIESFKELLTTALRHNYSIMTMENYLDRDTLPGKVIIMRHDVDRRPGNALLTALVERELGVKASYYFRIVAESFSPDIIKKIAALGHEIGYHYEDLATARGDREKAFDSFQENLARLREFYPVKTISMHGSPLSGWDNRELWENYNYRELGISGEPYLDLNFTGVGYLTDTGRRWDGAGVSVRDRVNSTSLPGIKSTFQLVAAIEKGLLPGHLMINTHPERWDDTFLPWLKQMLWQNIKNIVKKAIIRHRKK